MPGTTNWILSNGRYQVKRQLGEGGMAFALLALDKNTGGDVVVKVPKPNMMADPEFAARFRREIRALRELDHDHIVPFLDDGEFEGTPFFVMELMAGGSLQDRLDSAGSNRTRPMPPGTLADWLEPIAAALDYIHQRFVHRDIKPSNLLFDADGNAYVGDFGIVKALSQGTGDTRQTMMTQTGMAIGTCAYMAPELAEGKKVDGRADQYALAATVYQTLSGRLPFEGTTLIEILRKQILGKIVPLHELAPTLPRTLTQVVEKGLSQDPAQRYPTCAAFAKAALATVQTLPAAGKLKQRNAVCPGCRTPFALPANPAGKSVKCPACKSTFMVARKPDKAKLPALPTQKNGRPDIPIAELRAPVPPTMLEKATPVKNAPPDKKRARQRRTALWLGGAGGLLMVPALLTVYFLGVRGRGTGGPINPGIGQPPLKVSAAGVNPAIRPPPLPAGSTITNSIGMKLAYIPPGTFTMGSPRSEQDQARRDGDASWAEQEIQHEVVITQGFYMGVYTVTQEEYKMVVGGNPSYFRAGGYGAKSVAGLDTRRLPVETVLWNDAKEFCRRLSMRDGKTYRLPTEAEWEYACRAGTMTAFHFGDTISTDQANYNGDFAYDNGKKGVNRNRATKVGSFPPNAWGLHDMHGNVYQWCEDWYDETYYNNSPDIDPLNSIVGTSRVVRGGSWYNKSRNCRSAYRSSYGLDYRSGRLGFRVVLPSS